MTVINLSSILLFPGLLQFKGKKMYNVLPRSTCFIIIECNSPPPPPFFLSVTLLHFEIYHTLLGCRVLRGGLGKGERSKCRVLSIHPM